MKSQRFLRVMICDDIEPIVEKYALILGSDPDIEIAGCAHSGKDAYEIALSVHPDVILMDIEMETVDAGIVASRKILSELPQTKIIILTVHQTDRMIFEAFSAGVVDYILKNSSSSDIIRSVKNAMNNTTSLDPAVFSKLRSKVTRIYHEQENTMVLINRLFRLSSIEIEVLDMFMDGMTRSEICRLRVVEMSTTKSQIRSILSKTGYASIADLIQALHSMQLKDFIKNMTNKLS